jgi:hypothetical protein
LILKTQVMEPLKIENLNVEDLQGNLDFVHSVVLHNYARMKHLGRFVGDWDDPVVVVHDIRKRKGLALGNEAMGVLKRTGLSYRGAPQQSGNWHVAHQPGFSFQEVGCSGRFI